MAAARRGRRGFIPGETPVSPGDMLAFACQRCGGCCRWTTPYVTPYDVWRLARHTGFSTDEILDRTALFRDGEGTPLLQLALDPISGDCCFLARESQSCLVHPARPFSCRAFPLGVRHGPGGDRLCKVRTLPECRGEGRGNLTAGGYLAANLTPEDWTWSRAYAALRRDVFSGDGRLAVDGEFLAYYLQILFDLDRLGRADYAELWAGAACRVRRARHLSGIRGHAWESGC